MAFMGFGYANLQLIDYQLIMFIEELKKVACLQGLSDGELQEVAATLKEFTQIVYEIFAAGQFATAVINMNTNISKSEAA